MSLFSLIFRLGTDNREFNSGVDNATKKAREAAGQMGKSFEDAAKGFGAALAGGALAMAFREAVEFGSKINDLSTQLGIGSDALQEIGFAAEQNGAKMDDFVSVFGKLSKARKAALTDPNGEEAKAFRALGVGVDTLKNARLEDILSDIAGKFQAGGDAQEMMADAMTVMGRNASAIFPTLANDFDATRESAHRLNQVLSPEAVKALDDWGDHWDIAKKKGKVALSELAGDVANLHGEFAGLIDVLMEVFDVMSDEHPGVKTFKEWKRDIALENEIQGANHRRRMGEERFGENPGKGGFVDRPLQDILNAPGPEEEFKGRKEGDFISRLIALNQKLEDAKNKLLAPDEKRLKLTKEIQEIDAKLLGNGLLKLAGFNVVEQNMQLELDRLGLVGEIKDIDSKTKEPKEAKLNIKTGDALTSVGNFLGTTGPSESERRLTSMEKWLEKIEAHTEKTSRNLWIGD